MIKSGRISKAGTTPIYIEYRFNRDKKRLFNTGRSIAPKSWNQQLQKVRRNAANCNELNNFLQNFKHKMEAIVDEAKLKGIVATADYVENIFLARTGTDHAVSREFWDLFESFIEHKKRFVGKDTVKDYQSLKKHLNSYEKEFKVKMDPSIIDFDFYNNFLYHLENVVVKPNGEIGLQKNSAGKQIKNLKAFLNYCMTRGLINHIDISGFKTVSVKSDNVYLTEEELDALVKLDLKKGSQLRKIRDMFIIGCETGLRYGDLKRLNWDHFDEEKKFIRCMVSKTIDKVVIPVSKRLKKILESYEYSDFPSGIHGNDINREIKLLAKKAEINTMFSRWIVKGSIRTEVKGPKYEFISTHTCRRTFCTNQHLKGVPAMYIMKISGHSTEKAFMKYIKINGDVAANKMLEIWNQFEN